MKCKLILAAPNGNESKLFRDIVEASTNVSEAIDMYYYTKTDDFKEAYKGKVDRNNEPVYTDINNGKYVHNVDYAAVEMDHTAEVFKEMVETVPRLVSQIENRISYLQHKKDETFVPKLQELRDVLESESINVSIPKFFEMSGKHIQSLHKISAEALKTSGNTKKDLLMFASLNKTAESYNVVHDFKAMLQANPEISKLFEGTFATIESTASKINDIRNNYVAKAREFLVEEFHKGDPTWSKKDILKTLRQADSDVQWYDHQVMHMGDSSDRVLYEASKRLRETDHTARRAQIEFSRDLEEHLNKLEKNFSGKAEDMFADIMLMHDNEMHVLDPTVTAESTGELQKKMYSKLQKVKGNKVMMDFLAFYSESMTTLQAGLPYKSRVGTRAPSVLRSELELLQGKNLQETGKLVGDNVANRFKASNLDMEKGELLDATGKPVKRVPTFFHQAYNSIDYNKKYKVLQKEYAKDKSLTEDQVNEKAHTEAMSYAKKELSQKISKDLVGSLQAYHAMATNFKAKFDMLHVFDAIEAVVGSDQRTYLDAPNTLLPRDPSKPPKSTPGSESKAIQQLRDIYDMQLYGQHQKDLGTFKFLGVDLDTNKVLRGATSATSLLQIPFNLTAMGANFSYGEYSNLMEAAGGEYYKFKNYVRGSNFYLKNLTSTMADIGARNPKGIVNLLEEHYDMLQNYGGTNISNSERTRLRRLLKTDTLYFTTSGTEHFLQTRTGLAFMDATMTYDSKGNETGSLLEAHSVVDGKLKIKDGIHIKNSKGDIVPYDDLQQNRIGDKIGAINRGTAGNYAKATSGAAKSHAAANMIMQFKGFFAEFVKKRFSKKRPNHILEKEVEGFYRTGATALFNFARDVKKFNLQVAKENWSQLTPHEKANIRRFVVESGMMLVTSAAAVMFGKMGKDIEEEYDMDKWEDRLALGAFRYAQYLTLRFRTELTAYVSPAEFMNLMKSPAATVSLLETTYDLIGQMADPLEEYEAGSRKGEYKLKYKLGKAIPIYKHLSIFDAEGIHDKALWLK